MNRCAINFLRAFSEHPWYQKLRCTFLNVCTDRFDRVTASFTFARRGGAAKKNRQPKPPGWMIQTVCFQARRATPITNVTRNTTRNKKNRIFAILAEAPAMAPNPNTAATIAIRKKIKA
jgi:hypothetical protein